MLLAISTLFPRFFKKSRKVKICLNSAFTPPAAGLSPSEKSGRAKRLAEVDVFPEVNVFLSRGRGAAAQRSAKKQQKQNAE